jgi:ATP-dependent DNA ligase
MPPVSPMLAKSVPKIPAPDKYADGLLYEPKWDGFRCIVFRDGDDIELGSRNERPLTRYFPELVAAFKESLPTRCVVDGEIITINGDRLDFERLLQRIHPAKSRVDLLAVETPASFVGFDLLALGSGSLMDAPLAERRQALEAALSDATAPVHLTGATRDHDTAQEWFGVFEGAGLDGVVAKPCATPYEPGKRAMLKIKHDRTADVVIAGYRLHKQSTPDKPLLGSLLVGLYDDKGQLQHIGVSASFPMDRRAELIEELKPLLIDPADHPWAAWATQQEESEDRMPGAQSRWNAGKNLSWVALKPVLVAEVAYDHMEGTRFRHTAAFRRWRPDRDASSCTYEQLEEPVKYDLSDILR